MEAKEKRIQIKQERIMKYFIEAAREIIKKDGIENVTIRKVADLAGYTSATLYNYFDNLSHLIFLANMCHLEAYNEKLPECIEDCKNSIEVYMSISKCYTLYAYDKPDIFESLFFTQKGASFEKYIEQYYELFPEKEQKNYSPLLNNLFHINNLYTRSLSLLAKCVEDGYLEEEKVIDFNDICLRFNKTLLEDVKDGTLKKEEALTLTLRYYYQLLGFYLKPEYKHLLEEFYPKLIK